MIKSTIVISDLHAGCRLGLYPPEGVTLDEGGKYDASPLQKKLWKMWRYFWDEWVPEVTKGEQFDIIVNGDMTDGRHHGSTTQVSQNLTDQKNIAYEIMEPILSHKNVHKLYIIRGTEAHAGKSGEDEEEIAKHLCAVPDENKKHSRWEMWYRMGKKYLVHLTHHIGSTNSAAYESTAVYKEAVEAYNEAGKWRLEPPDVVVRSHRHRYFQTVVPTAKGLGIAVVTPGWQLKTPFLYRLGMGRSSTPQIGGICLKVGHEDGIYTRCKVWNIGRPEEVVV